MGKRNERASAEIGIQWLEPPTPGSWSLTLPESRSGHTNCGSHSYPPYSVSRQHNKYGVQEQHTGHKRGMATGIPYNIHHGKWIGFEAPEDLVTRSSSTQQYGRLMSTVIGPECTIDDE